MVRGLVTRASSRLLVLLLLAAGLATALPAGAERAGSGLLPDQAAALDTGGSHSCGLLEAGGIRCWGNGDDGRLGYNSTDDIGDTEHPDSVGPVQLGATATAIAVGLSHTCALLTGGQVRCWGNGGSGQLGYNATDDIGDTEHPDSVGPVQLGATATAITAGGLHACALLTGGQVRCWGSASNGQLGYNSTANIGDTEHPDSVGPVQLGATATAITAGTNHTCALLTGGQVRCWGSGSLGQLGYNSAASIGDTEHPDSVGPVQLGGTATAIAAGGLHTCALLTTGQVRCWGSGSNGRLGYNSTASIGDTEHPDSVGPVQLGGTAIAISGGDTHTCALLTTGQVRCWGSGGNGQLGYNSTASIGDTEHPDSVGPVQLGGTATAISGGGNHTCALLTTGQVRCWGSGNSGRLGYNSTASIGDTEEVDTAGPLQLGGPLIRSRGDLSLTANATPTSRVVGQPVTVTATVTNTGPHAQPGVRVRMGIPPNLDVTTATPTLGTFTGDIWSVPALASGGSATLMLTTTAAAPGSARVSAELTAASLPDPDSSPNNSNPAEDDHAFAPEVTISGAQGPPGTGQTGARGPTGATGARGPRGRNAKVTCKVTQRKRRKPRIRCTVRLRASGATRASLTRRGRTYARVRVRKGRVRISASPGRYVLHVRFRSGRLSHTAIRLR